MTAALDYRECVTKSRGRLHYTKNAATTLCEYLVFAYEPEVAGTVRRWYHAVPLLSCRRCRKKLKEAAES